MMRRRRPCTLHRPLRLRRRSSAQAAAPMCAARCAGAAAAGAPSAPRSAVHHPRCCRYHRRLSRALVLASPGGGPAWAPALALDPAADLSPVGTVGAQEWHTGVSALATVATCPMHMQYSQIAATLHRKCPPRECTHRAALAGGPSGHAGVPVLPNRLQPLRTLAGARRRRLKPGVKTVVARDAPVSAWLVVQRSELVVRLRLKLARPACTPVRRVAGSVLVSPRYRAVRLQAVATAAGQSAPDSAATVATIAVADCIDAVVPWAVLLGVGARVPVQRHAASDGRQAKLAPPTHGERARPTEAPGTPALALVAVVHEGLRPWGPQLRSRLRCHRPIPAGCAGVRRLALLTQHRHHADAAAGLQPPNAANPANCREPGTAASGAARAAGWRALAAAVDGCNRPHRSLAGCSVLTRRVPHGTTTSRPPPPSNLVRVIAQHGTAFYARSCPINMSKRQPATRMRDAASERGTARVVGGGSSVFGSALARRRSEAPDPSTCSPTTAPHGPAIPPRRLWPDQSRGANRHVAT